jgi:hypothetical protein
MGLDKTVIKFLISCNKRYFGKTLLIGHQMMFANQKISQTGILRVGEYSGPFFQDVLGASSVESIDISKYEGATYEHDLNKTLPRELFEQYDTVFDGGTLEHVHDVVTAMDNIAAACRKGGTIIHVLPANNFCGHGFYQFSPELFISRYQVQNGYLDTEIYLASVLQSRYWYRVTPPTDGTRVNLMSRYPVYILVKTRKNFTGTKQIDVQQSDYQVKWESKAEVIPDCSECNRNAKMIQRILGNSLIQKMQLVKFRRYSKLNKRNPSLRREKIAITQIF